MTKERYVFELPEKVYIDDFGSGFSHGWHTEHSYENDIEYVRKDVFIKKFEKWIKHMYSETDYRFNEDFTGMLINDFKNYVEEV